MRIFDCICKLNSPPNDIVDNRTDCEGQFNDEFIKEDELDNLW